MNLHVQWLTVAYMSFAGAMLAFAFDWLRTFVSQSLIFSKLRWLFECLYWSFATVFVFRSLLVANDGQMRIYVPLFIILGGFVYFRYFSSRARRFMLFLILPIKKLSMMFARLLKSLVLLIVMPIYWLVIKPACFVVTVIFHFIQRRWHDSCDSDQSSKPKT